MDTDRQNLNRRLRRYLRHGMLPQLAAFETVLRMGSVTRAADALAMAQPTVSGHLRKLSESIGLALFETRGRHLVPTAAALALHAAVAEMFDSLERVDEVLGAMRDEHRPPTQAMASLMPLQPAQIELLSSAPQRAAPLAVAARPALPGPNLRGKAMPALPART